MLIKVGEMVEVSITAQWFVPVEYAGNGLVYYNDTYGIPTEKISSRRWPFFKHGGVVAARADVRDLIVTKKEPTARKIAAMLLAEYRTYKRKADNAYSPEYGAVDDALASVLRIAYQEAKKIINASA